MRSDEQIRDAILEEIDFDPKVGATDIGVTVKDRAVTLHGTVHSHFEKPAVINAAKRVRGVQAVAEVIRIKYPSDTKIDDEDIAERMNDTTTAASGSTHTAMKTGSLPKAG